MEQEKMESPKIDPKKADELLTNSMCALAVGTLILEYVRALPMEAIADLTDRSALCLLEAIKSILEKDGLDDPQCFHRIEAIINAYEACGISIKRHDY